MEFSDELIKEIEEHHNVTEPALVQELLETALSASIENDTNISKEIYMQDVVTVTIAKLMINSII